MARAFRHDVPRVRWFIEPPMADETLESVLERAYQAYHGISLAREGWLVDFCRPGLPAGAWDSRAMVRVAHALGVSARRLRATAVPDGPAFLAPTHRRAFCRACWVHDDRVGRPRHFRRAWAGALTLRCFDHDEPLRVAPALRGPLADVPVSLDPPVLGHRERDIIDMVDAFAQTLDRCLHQGAPWPSDWRLDALRARNALGRCVSNLLLNPAHAPFQWAWLGEGSGLVGETPMRTLTTTRGSVWDSFRHIDAPAARRAALWLVAWIVLPDAPDALRPAGLEEHLFRQDPAHMAREEARSAGRRLSRLRQALSRESIAWRL